MISVGLSGARYSGKDKITKLFSQILIPVFNADALLKFILNNDYKVLGELKRKIGYHYFKNGNLDFDYIQKNSKFDEVLDFIEPIIYQKYIDFQKKHTGQIYTIFHYSLLFERSFNKKMDKNICVFAPKNIRTQRCMFLTGKSLTMTNNLISSEFDDLLKNQMSDFIIHNYEYGDIFDSVCKIDKQIVDLHLNTKK